jgi:hypothetical protein
VRHALLSPVLLSVTESSRCYILWGNIWFESRQWHFIPLEGCSAERGLVLKIYTLQSFILVSPTLCGSFYPFLPSKVKGVPGEDLVRPGVNPHVETLGTRVRFSPSPPIYMYLGGAEVAIYKDVQVELE